MDWLKTLGSIAPALATAIGGPLAGAATKFIAANLLGDESASIEQIESAVLGASPDQLTELKAMDLDFKKHMASLGVDVFKIEAEDKQSARAEHKHSKMPAVLSVMMTMFIIGIVVSLFSFEPPTGAREVLFMLLGVVVKEWSNSMGFWYGSTRSSQIKTEMMKR